MQNASPDRPSNPASERADARDCVALVVSARRAGVERLRERLASIADRVDSACGGDEAERLLRGLWYDVVIVDADGFEDAPGVCGRLLGASPEASIVLHAAEATVGLATAAMRAGASDLIGADCSAAEFSERVHAAVRASAERRASADREARLRRLCSKLDRARREVTGQVGDLCTNLAGAYQDLTEQIGDLATAGELNGLLRQELDVENLLRVLLEYLLGKVGSTNAGVFLPGSMGDYTLGAYINYDRPRESAEARLDEMAGLIAPAFEDARDVVKMVRPSELRERLGEAAGWFEDECVLAVGCHDSRTADEPECLAVLCLFRDRRTPFPVEAVRTVQIAAELFGKQMARVVRVHHRHKPDELWDVDDDIDLAA